MGTVFGAKLPTALYYKNWRKTDVYLTRFGNEDADGYGMCSEVNFCYETSLN